MRTDCIDPFDKALSLEVVDDQEILVTGEVTSTDADYYRLDIPTNLAGDIVYFELVGSDLELTLYDNQITAMQESDGAGFFGSIGFGLGGSSLANQAIRTEIICRGPCIIVEKAKEEVYLKIRTKSRSTNYEFYSFSDVYQDKEKPNNNDCGLLDTSTIITVPVDQEFIGALETLKDKDCYKSVALQITSNTTIDVKAEIFDLSGKPYPNKSTNTLKSVSGDINKQILTIDPPQAVIVRVTADSKRAAAAGNSQYKLSFEPLVN